MVSPFPVLIRVFAIRIKYQSPSGSGTLKSNERSASKTLLQSGIRRLCYCFLKMCCPFLKGRTQIHSYTNHTKKIKYCQENLFIVNIVIHLSSFPLQFLFLLQTSSHSHLAGRRQNMQVIAFMSYFFKQPKTRAH